MREDESKYIVREDEIYCAEANILCERRREQINCERRREQIYCERGDESKYIV